jgi:hypothetical protein
MGLTEQEYFAEVARKFLSQNVGDPTDDDSLRILSVTVNGQVINGNSTVPTAEGRYNPQRRLQVTNSVEVSVKGKYRPPVSGIAFAFTAYDLFVDRHIQQRSICCPFSP